MNVNPLYKYKGTDMTSPIIQKVQQFQNIQKYQQLKKIQKIQKFKKFQKTQNSKTKLKQSNTF